MNRSTFNEGCYLDKNVSIISAVYETWVALFTSCPNIAQRFVGLGLHVLSKLLTELNWVWLTGSQIKLDLMANPWKASQQLYCLLQNSYGPGSPVKKIQLAEIQFEDKNQKMTGNEAFIVFQNVSCVTAVLQ